MERKSVLLLAATGYVIRDILLGPFADELIKHADLLVATPSADDESLKRAIAGKPIHLFPFTQMISFLGRTEMSFGQYLCPQHWMYWIKQVERDNLSLDLVTRLYQPNWGFKGRQLLRFMLFTGKAIKTLRLTGLSEELFLFLVSREFVTQQWIKIFQEMKPSAIVSTMLTLPGGMYDYSVDLPAVLAAKQLNIPCGTLVQSWDNLSSKTYVLPTWLNRFWTWSESMTNDLIRFNPRIKQSERIVDIGNPHFDYHLDSNLIESRETFMRNLEMYPQFPFLLVGTGQKYLLPEEPDIVINLVKKLKREIPNLQVLMRMHPKDKMERWQGRLENLRSLGVKIQNPIPDKPMDSGGFTPPQEFFREQINAIYHSAVVINTASSLTVDAAILGRPVISLAYDVIKDPKFPEGRARFCNRSEHFGSLVKTGGVWVVRSQAECIDAIRCYLAEPELHASNRRVLARKVGGALDSMAGVRLAKQVLDLVQDD